MKTSSVIVLTVVLPMLVVTDAGACTPARAYDVVKPVSYPVGKDFVPPTPRVAVEKLKRGFDDGNYASCSDAGILTIVVKGRAHPDVAGYTFRTKEGSFPDAVFPDAVLAPVDLGNGQHGFRFAWLDLPHGQRKLEPIDATVEVRLVSRSGKKSEPLLLHVMHAGGY